MRRTLVIGGVVAAAIAVAVTGGDARARGGADQPPTSLLMSVARGPAGSLDGVRAFANAIQPGAGAMLSDELVGATLAKPAGMASLDGLDPAAPTYLLVVDGGRGARGAAVLGKVADEHALAASAGGAFVQRAKGWAVIGPRAVVEQVAPFALRTLARDPAPAQPTATIYVQHVLGRYRAEIEQTLSSVSAVMSAQGNPQMVRLLQLYTGGIMSAARDTDRVIVTMDVDPQDATLDVALVPRARTRLARFVGAQHPSDYAMLGKLPDDPALFVIAGHLESGPYRAGLLELMAQMYGPSMPTDVIQAIAGIMDASTGDLAMTMTIAPGAGMSVTELWGVSDPRAADKGIGYALGRLGAGRTFDVMGIKTTMKVNPGTTVHGGVTLRSYDTIYDLSGVPPAKRAAMAAMMPAQGLRAQIGVAGKLGVMAMAADSDAAAARTIDAARGKGAHYVPSKELARLLASSSARRDSLAMVIDLGALMRLTQPMARAGASHVMVWSLGFADHAAHMRFAVPAATVRALMGRP